MMFKQNGKTPFNKLKLAARFPAAARDRVKAWTWPRWKIDPLVRQGGVEAPPPITFSINLTHLCNLRCGMCGQWRRKDVYRKETLPLVKLKEVVDEIAPFKPKIYIWGGEPLLYPEFAGLLAYLKEKRLFVIVNTNGALLERYAERMAECGVNGLDISIDGPPEVHDEIRGVPGTFDRVMAGVSRLRNLQKRSGRKKAMLKAVCVVTEANQDRLEETLRTVEETGFFDALIFNLGWFTSRELGEATDRFFRKNFGCGSRSWEDFVGALGNVDPAKVRGFMERVNSPANRNSIPVFFIPVVKPEEVGAYYRNPELPIGKKFCYNPWLNPDLRPNGDVTFCPDFPDYTVGNVKEKRFLEIWNGEKAKKFRRVLLEKGLFPLCSRCCGLYAY